MPKTVALLITLIFSVQSFAHSVKVYPKHNHSLQVAVNEANSGDTLYIQSGTYNEQNILVDKRLTLIGENYPVIDGQKKGQLIVITHDSVVIAGLQLQNTGRSSMTDMAAIRLQDVARVTIDKNKLFNNTYGVYLQNSHYCTILNNAIHASSMDELNSGNGIHAWKSTNLYIGHNEVSGHRDGIYFEFVTDSKIYFNISTHNVRYGLHFMFSHRDTYSNNQFADNGAGVAVMYSKYVDMHNNTFRHNWGDAAYAILLKEISDSKIEHNLFIKNTVGIYMEGTSRIEVKYNEFKENGWALRVQASCDGNSFEKNNFMSNSFDVATNGTMMLNIFRQNYWDKYDGYDLNRNKVGDVPYYPVSMYSVVTEKIPSAMILYRSFLTDIMNQVEKLMPSVIPDNLRDDMPMMKSWKLK
jgi:nitrous oxidase accessory protein